MERFASFDRGIASASPSASRATGVLLLGRVEECDWDRMFPGRCFIVMFGSGRFEGSDAGGTGVFSISTGLPPSSTNSIASGSWEANKAVSFTSYGVANERAEGRLPVLKVTLHFDGGTVLSTATLTAACRLGSPPATAKEGRDPQRGVDVQPRHPCHGYHDLWRSAPGLRPLRFDILEIGETWFVRSGDLKRT